MYHHSSRAGAALVSATIILVLLSSIAVVLTDRTVSAMTMEQRRTEELTLALAAESAANKAYVYLQGQSTALLKVNDTYQVKSTTLPNETALNSKESSTLIDATAMGMTAVNLVPVTARWCYLGQRAVHNTTDANGNFVVETLAGFTSGTALTAAQITAGYVVQDVYKVRALAVVGSSADPNRWRQRQVDMVFTPTSAQVLTRALFSNIGYTIQGSPSGDSWSSAASATYGAATKTTPITAGSNGSVNSTEATIVGQGNLNLTLPMPTVDTTAAYNIPVAGGGPNILNNTVTLTTGTYHAKYIDITSGDLVTISGQVTINVDGPVTFQTANGNNAAKVLTYNNSTTDRLTIIQADYDPTDPLWSTKETLFDMNGNSGAGSPNNPSQFIYVSAHTGSGKFNGTANFGGVIYAPNMSMQLNGNFDMFGAMLVNSFGGMINGNFHMHYDQVLASLTLPLNTGFTVAGWYASNPVWGGGTVK
jgi:VCBS repeat-containing protein